MVQVWENLCSVDGFYRENGLGELESPEIYIYFANTSRD